MTRTFAAALWIAFFAAAALFAPATREDVWPWCEALLRGDFAGTDPTVVAHFQLMGVWPLTYLVLLRRDLLARPLPALPFVLGSMALGAFVLLPWFILRPAARPQQDDKVAQLLGHVVVRAAISVMAAGLIGWGLATGDLSAWAQVRATEGFVWTMTIDFGILWAVSALVARESGGRWWLALVPFGALWAA